MCISLGDKQADCLSNLRLADDVLLFSTSLKQLKKMMSEFKRSTKRVGLKTHPEENEDSLQPKDPNVKRKQQSTISE